MSQKIKDTVLSDHPDLLGMVVKDADRVREEIEKHEKEIEGLKKNEKRDDNV